MKHLKSIIRLDALKASGTMTEFYRYYLQNNLDLLFIACIFLTLSETVLLILPARAFNYHPILVIFLIVNIVLVIAMMILKKNYAIYNSLTLSVVQHLACINIIALASGLNFASINIIDYIHPSIIALTFLAIAFEMKISELILYVVGTVTVNVTGMYMLYVNPVVRFSGVSNFIIFSLVAFTMGIVVSRIRISGWLNHITVLKQNEMLEDLIKRDPMTRLFNHESILSHLRQQIKFREQYGDPLCVLILDVDDFKKINDTYGHLKGDEILLGVTRAIKTSVRASDIVGRYGGEEFFLIFPKTDYKEAVIISERIRQSVETIPMPDAKKVTVSGGLTLVNQNSVDEIIRQADQRLYIAKHQGKNRIVSTD